MYSDFYSTESVAVNSFDSTWLVVSAVFAVVGGILAYALFIKNKNKGEYTGFLSWLHEFLNFKKFFIDVILKIMYCVTAIFVTLSSFSFIGNSVATFFLILIVGNIVARIAYEMILMLLTIANNTTEINKKLSQNKKEQEKSKKKSE